MQMQRYKERETKLDKLQCMWLVVAATLVVCVSTGCGKSNSHVTGAQPPATESSYSAPTYAGKMEADDGQWVRPAKDYASTRYSSLDQINTSNAKQLKVAWTFSTGMDRGHEAAPL